MLRQGNFHLAAFAASISSGTDVDTAAVSDQVLTINNSHFFLPRPMGLWAAMALGATLTRMRIASATLRQVLNLDIRPINVSALPGSNTNIMLMDDQPPGLPALEELQCLTSSAAACGEPDALLIWLGEQKEPIPPGTVYPWRWTSTTAAVANSWTLLTITFADTLPAGEYVVVGSEHFSTNARAHRIRFPDQYYRPGMPSFATTGLRLPYAMGMRQFGVFGRFFSNVLPQVEVFCNGTDNSHTGWLHVIRVGTNTLRGISG